MDGIGDHVEITEAIALYATGSLGMQDRDDPDGTKQSPNLGVQGQRNLSLALVTLAAGIPSRTIRIVAVSGQGSL